MEAHCNENLHGYSVFLTFLSRNGGGEFGASIPGMHSSFIHGIALPLGINCKYVLRSDSSAAEL